ncbi:MAG: N(4)-(beta-N-acetylglucosaminyl)-L-asparaginase [Saprospiraceae bacterium]
MEHRRGFIRKTLGIAGLPLFNINTSSLSKASNPPMILSTWDFGLKANEAAMETLKNNLTALDAVEAGVMVPENDPNNTSVGYGALPDRDGVVTLDACIMDHMGSAGSVCALEQIRHPISVARRVMEKTPHVMLVGDGALDFAVAEGFKKENLLTSSSMEKWEKWKITSNYKPKINVENHDTIGMIAWDKHRNFAGACTTSGLAYKMHGRVGDSPVIGSGLYVDNLIGAATGTGLGELVLRQCSTFLIVELMRQGYSPQKACEESILRIIKSTPSSYKDIQVAFIAVNRAGRVGAYSIQPGFTYALYQEGENKLVKSKSYISA